MSPTDDDPSIGDAAESDTAITVLLDATLDADDPTSIRLLTDGDIEVHGRMPWSSNGTFLVSVSDATNRVQAIYKPESGERPLWDFPAGLWRRELATYLLARSLEWPVVPPTVERDGPMGIGSLQFFVSAHFEQHYFTVSERDEHRHALQQICVLDVLSNNTDRKGGHVLVGRDDRLWAIDHGLNFHAEFKLRTVMWDFAGEPIPTDIVESVGAFLDAGVPDDLVDLLAPDEVGALVQRARGVVSSGRFPTDPTGRRYPWPLV